jgi:large subunit ribosomal protein L33
MIKEGKFLQHSLSPLNLRHKRRYILGRMAKGKVKTLAIKLVSTAGTGFFYVSTKNPKNVTHKLALKKYDPIVRQHVVFNESKIK